MLPFFLSLTTHPHPNSMANERKLTSVISQSINAKMSREGTDKVAFRLDDKESPSEVKSWISTGSTVLDLMISNQKQGGLPSGRIVALYGSSGSGKSLIASHVLADCQQQGGVSIFIDTEAASDFSFMKTIGIDPEGDFLYIAENRLEKIFEMIETIIVKHKERNERERPVTIVLDSIAGSVTENEYEGDYSKEGYNTDKAIVLSRAMRKITGLINKENVLLLVTNQVRTDPSVMYGDPHTTPGGVAVKFHSSVRIKMRRSKAIKESKQVVGAKIRPQVTKNRLAPPHRHTSFDLYYNSGIDDFGSWWGALKNAGYLDSVSNGWYRILKDKDGDEAFTKKEMKPDSNKNDVFKLQESHMSKLLHEDPAFRSRIYDLLADAIMHEYEDGWVDRSNREYVGVEEAPAD